MASRTAPNVLITGTPGTGKTTTAEQVAAKLGLRHLNVGDLIKEKKFYSGWDEEFQAFEIDEASEDAVHLSRPF